MQATLLIGKLHHQNTVLGYQPDKGNHTNLRIDVERAKSKVQRNDSTEDRKRNRHHDDERIAEAFELRRKHQIDHDNGKAEGDHDRVALLDFQTRLTGIVEEEAFRHLLLRQIDECLQALTCGDTRHWQSRNRCRIQLVELLDSRRRRVRLDLDDRRQRNHLARNTANIEITELFRIGTIDVRHLTDDIIAV